MQFVFLGGRPLGARCLREMISRKLDIRLVVPNNDEFEEPLWFDSTAQIAKDAGLRVVRTARINSELVDEIRAMHPDAILSIFFQQILKRPILEAARLGCFNVHFAPLPRYRGFYPQMHAIINGEAVHGVTMHFMDEGIDTGDIVIQKSLPVLPTDTGKSLYMRCVDVGFDVFQTGLECILREAIPRIPQDHQKATYYRKEIPNNREIDWSKSPEEILRFIRALTFAPFPPPYFRIGAQNFEVMGHEEE